MGAAIAADAPVTVPEERGGSGQRRDTAGVAVDAQWLFVAAVAAGFALHALRPLPAIPAAFALPLGVVLGAIGVALCWSAARILKRAGTTVQPDEPSSAIVESGPYGFSRNPIYLGMVLLGAGIGLVFGAGWVLVLLVPAVAVVQKGVIEREEAYLERRFPETYRAYKGRVRRWLWRRQGSR